MKKIWVISLMLATSVYAKGPVYNFNFYNGKVVSDTPSKTIPVQQVVTEQQVDKDTFRGGKWGLELSLGSNTGPDMKFDYYYGGNVIDFGGSTKKALRVKYGLSDRWVLSVGYSSLELSSSLNPNIDEILGQGGIIGIQYLERLGKHVSLSYGFDFEYLKDSRVDFRTDEFTFERMSWRISFGPQLHLGKIHLSLVAGAGATKNNILTEAYPLKELIPSADITASFGFMI